MASVANDSSDDTSSTTSDSTEGTSDVDMASVITDEDRTAAEAFKVIGNEHFTTSRYPQAAEAYTAAIEKNPQSAVYFSNRAATFLKMEQFGLAMRDAKQGIALDSKYVKAYYRLASSYMSLGKFKLRLQILFFFPLKVRCQNEKGWSLWSPHSQNMRTSSAPPDPVESVDFTRLFSRLVSICWNVPKCNGEVVDAYEVLHQE